MSMNSWSFSGRCGADAELRTTPSGEKVLSFRVAVDVGWGEKKTTMWVEVSYWGKRAEAIAKYVTKGMKLGVVGPVRLEEFQRRDGTPGSKLTVRADDIDLGERAEGGGGRDYEAGGGGSGGGQRGGGGGQDYGNQTGGAKRGGGKPAFDQDLDDEIPY